MSQRIQTKVRQQLVRWFNEARYNIYRRSKIFDLDIQYSWSL